MRSILPRSTIGPAVLPAALLGAFLISGAGVSLPAQECCLPRIEVKTDWLVTGGPEWIAADALGSVYVSLSRGNGSYTGFTVSDDDGEDWTPFTVPQGDEIIESEGVAFDEGGIVIAYRDRTRVMATRSSDQARSFSDPVVLGPAGFGTHLGLDAGPNGVVAVVWLYNDSDPHRSYVAVSSDEGRTWRTTLLREDDNVGDLRSLETAAVTDRSVVVVNVERDLGWYSTSGDQGLNWTTPRNFFSLRGTGPGFHLTTSGEGNVQLLYWETDPATDERRYRVRSSQDGGFTWRNEQTTLDTLIPPRIVEMSGRLLSAPGGRVWAAWTWRLNNPTDPVYLNRSSDHASPGSWWGTPGPAIPAAVQAHHLRLVAPDRRNLDLIHDDYRDDEGCGETTCESVYLARSCDGGDTWLEPELHLDEDAPPLGTHSEDPEAIISSTGRIHVVWSGGTGASGQTRHVRHAGLDPALLAPRIELTGGPATECGPYSYSLHAVPDSLGWCELIGLQWFMDGDPIPGANQWDYQVPGTLSPATYSFHYEVTCDGPSPCGFRSRPYTLTLEEVPHAPPEEIDGVLRVARRDWDLELRWEDRDFTALGHNLYAGTLAYLHDQAAYDHETLACHIPRSPAGAPETSHLTPTPPEDTYYLVAPATCLEEGRVGEDSEGRARPLAPAGAACGPLP